MRPRFHSTFSSHQLGPSGSWPPGPERPEREPHLPGLAAKLRLWCCYYPTSCWPSPSRAGLISVDDLRTSVRCVVLDPDQGVWYSSTAQGGKVTANAVPLGFVFSPPAPAPTDRWATHVPRMVLVRRLRPPAQHPTPPGRPPLGTAPGAPPQGLLATSFSAVYAATVASSSNSSATFSACFFQKAIGRSRCWPGCSSTAIASVRVW